MMHAGQRLLAHVVQLATADSMPPDPPHPEHISETESGGDDDDEGAATAEDEQAEETALPGTDSAEERRPAVEAPLERHPPRGDEPRPEGGRELKSVRMLLSGREIKDSPDEDVLDDDPFLSAMTPPLPTLTPIPAAMPPPLFDSAPLPLPPPALRVMATWSRYGNRKGNERRPAFQRVSSSQAHLQTK